LKDLLKCWGCALDAFLYQQYSNRIYRRSTCNNRCKNLLISLEGQQIKGKNFIVKAIRPKVLCNIFSIISYQNVNSFIRCRKFLFLAQISSQIVSANLARTAWWFSSFCIFPFTLNSLISPFSVKAESYCFAECIYFSSILQYASFMALKFVCYYVMSQFIKFNTPVLWESQG